MKNKKTNSSRKPTTKNRGSKASTNESDIIQLILKDHMPLKKLIKILKDSDCKMSVKRPAFEKFAPMLLAHAKPEEESLYARLKEGDDELRTEGFEGETEHAIADELIEQIKQTQDEDNWMAKVKVLGELVEHHIEEEEGEMFRMVKKEFDIETRVAIGETYMSLKEKFEEENMTEDTQPKNRKPKNEEQRHV